MQGIEGIFYIIILIASVIVHEVAHGLAADYFGDPTARIAGRLSLNPLRHLDLFGSVILPLLLILSSAGIVVGWAKPVPYNPELLRNRKVAVPIVAIAGVVVNLALAIIFGLLIRTALTAGIEATGFYTIASLIVLVNLVLALFNILPLPPLDGFHLLFSLLPWRLQRYQRQIESYGLIFLIVFILFGWKFIAPLALYGYSALTGLAL